MMRDLEEKLAKDFTFMRFKDDLETQKKSGFINDLYSAFFIECEDGWFDLIYDTCKKIQAVYNKYGIEPDFEPTQIKEKYGTLSFYYSTGWLDEYHEIEKYQKAWQEIDKIVEESETKSAYICERCGKPGSIRDGFWIKTLCDDCNESNDAIMRAEMFGEF